MNRSSLKLKNELRRLRRKLFENRGEWPGCYSCPLQLVCFMKRVPRRARWCLDCDGWSLRDKRLIVKCQGFRVKEFVDHQAAAMGRCPNCNRLEPEYETYRVIEGRLMERTLDTDARTTFEQLLHKYKTADNPAGELGEGSTPEMLRVFEKRMKQAMYGDLYVMRGGGKQHR